MLKQINEANGIGIRELRKAAGLTQMELARRVALPQSHIAKIEAGKSDPRFSTVLAIVQALGFDLAVGDPTTLRIAKAFEQPSRKARFA